MINIVYFVVGVVIGYFIKHRQSKKFLTQNLTKTEKYIIEKMNKRKNKKKCLVHNWKEHQNEDGKKPDQICAKCGLSKSDK